MNEEYLWDRSGERDEEVARLEELAGQLRYVARPAQKVHWRWTLAAAAALVVMVTGVGMLFRPGEKTDWRLTINGHASTQVRRGELIETKNGTIATLESSAVGEVHVEPSSKLRLTKSGEKTQQFALERGTIHAFIWAPPTQFVVDTPGAKTVDLGCQYTLTVEPDGSGELTVTMGWVAFQAGNLESFIPAGAKCKTRPGHGPGTPYRADAPQALVDGLSEFDRDGNSGALANAMASARPEDAFTLWHLLSRTKGEQRAQVFAAFSSKVALPANVTRQAILSGDEKTLDAAWNALQLGDTAWWRLWKHAKAPGVL